MHYMLVASCLVSRIYHDLGVNLGYAARTVPHVVCMRQRRDTFCRSWTYALAAEVTCIP